MKLTLDEMTKKYRERHPGAMAVMPGTLVEECMQMGADLAVANLTALKKAHEYREALNKLKRGWCSCPTDLLVQYALGTVGREGSDCPVHGRYSK